MAKIAVLENARRGSADLVAELDRALARRSVQGMPGRTAGRLLARGDGWAVEDVICTSGPGDRSFEEQHTRVSIAIVVAGTFQYRSTAGRALMTPGSILLGNPGQCFECGHEHGAGDRCIAFRFAPEHFERIAADAGAGATMRFRSPRLPALRESAGVTARAYAGLVDPTSASWEEIGVRLAARVACLVGDTSLAVADPQADAVARVTRAVRAIDRRPSARLTLSDLAAESDLSPYHFLRVFERLTGVTPHQYVLRARLRQAATRLAVEPTKVIDIALDAGFGDVSNFNRAFRAEFGVSPRAYRAATDATTSKHQRASARAGASR